MFIFITAPSWCRACMAMEEHTIPDTDFIMFINRHFVPVLVPDEKNGETNADLFEYEFGWTYPSYLVVSPTETVLYKDAGYVSAGQLIGELGPYTSELNQENTEDYEAGADTEEMDWGGVTYSELARMRKNYLKNHARQYTKQSIAAFRYNDGGDITYFFTRDANMIQFSLFRDEVIAY